MIAILILFVLAVVFLIVGVKGLKRQKADKQAAMSPAEPSPEEVHEKLKGVQFVAHYGEERELDATPEEMEIANYIMSLCPVSHVVRVSKDYITVKCEETDICRIKYTDRAKWIIFPYLENKEKRRLSFLEELPSFDDAIAESYAFACRLDNID